MAREDAALRRWTWLLLALAALTAESAAAPNGGTAEYFGVIAALVATALLGEWRSRRAILENSFGLFAVFAALLAAPLLFEPIVRQFSSAGRPLELLLIAGLRNLGLGLSVLSARPACARLAALVSLFLMLFAVSLGESALVLILLGCYGAAGGVWLMLVYWDTLRPPSVAARVAAVETAEQRLVVPWLAVLPASALLVAALPLALVGPERTVASLGEWLSSSGGTGDHDPFARGGVNDGDEETSGENPHSTGFVETDRFLDSPLPSLYDLFNDLYGEPIRRRDHEQAIALTAQDRVSESPQRPGDNQRPGRDFPTARRGPTQPRRTTDRAARALFEVEGRTPLHIRMTVFDRFDGIAWSETPRSESASSFERMGRTTWFRPMVAPLPEPAFRPGERHRFKIARLDGCVLPAPPHVARFRLGRVDRADFFASPRPGIFCLAHRKVASATTFETESALPDPRQLESVRFGVGTRRDDEPSLQLPATLDARVNALARSWAGARPHGWPQIAAIVDRLRAEFHHEPERGESEAPLSRFLFEAQRGPDYQFASACAALLRSLGYPTRLACGFYATPAAYDPDTRHTPVVADDLHFWPEVRLPGGDWLVLEPTPGYDVPRPAPSLGERLSALAIRAARHARDHALALGAALALGVVAAWRRHALADWWATTWWRWTARESDRRAVLRALRLLERRARWAGRPRPAHATARRWLTALLNSSDAPAFAPLVDWAAYAPATTAMPPGPALAACRAALAALPLPRFRRAANDHADFTNDGVFRNAVRR